ncbi:PH domain-containing protein, partial [Clostridium butyricum]
MIDFKNSDFLKLKKISNEEVINQITPLLISGECLISSYKTIRDFVVFTNKRVIAVNVQGITGSKKDFTSLPYSKVQAYSIETAGTFDLDSE